MITASIPIVSQEVEYRYTMYWFDFFLTLHPVVFAYGATGAGKTFTMLGAPGFPGITFLTMMELYQRIHEIREEKSCDVRVSYLEVGGLCLQNLAKYSM